MKIALSTLVLLAVLVAPSLAALTDYQSGFEAGLKSGFSLGKAYQQSTDGKISIQQYNQVAASYNALIQSLFAGNQTALGNLIVSPMHQAGTQVIQHIQLQLLESPFTLLMLVGIKARLNMSILIRKVTIHGYDPDTYYTMVGWGGSGLPNAQKVNGRYVTPTDSNGNSSIPVYNHHKGVSLFISRIATSLSFWPLPGQEVRLA